jgi:hypothetical protein
VQPIHRQSINQNKDDPMKPFLFRIAMLCFLSVLGISMAAAQALDCPALFQEALAAARTNCEDVSRNEACLAYGSLSTDAGELSERAYAKCRKWLGADGDASSAQPAR